MKSKLPLTPQEYVIIACILTILFVLAYGQVRQSMNRGREAYKHNQQHSRIHR